MSNPKEHSGPACFSAKVLSNAPVRPCYYRILLELDKTGSGAFLGVQPGQFAELDLSALPLPPADEIPRHVSLSASRQIILRRPFSFSRILLSDADRPTLSVEMLYCVVGPGTLRMTTLKPGDSVSVIGPLGNGFFVPRDKALAVLVAGGMGAPPLLHLAAHLRISRPHMRVLSFAGARCADAFPFSLDDGAGLYPEFLENVHLATDDGSAGYHGFVTSCMRDWFQQEFPDPAQTVIFTCGPEVMLHQVSLFAAESGIDAQVSMERMMACGIGLCQSCAVEVASDRDDQREYRLCCKDGPVFESRRVRFRL